MIYKIFTLLAISWPLAASEAPVGKISPYAAVTFVEFSAPSPDPTSQEATNFFKALLHRPLAITLVPPPKKADKPFSEPGYYGYSCTLPKGPRWGDGVYLDAADFNVTWQKLKEQAFARSGALEPTKVVLDSADSQTFRIYFALAIKDGLRTLNGWYLYPSHLHEQPDVSYQSEKQHPGLYNGAFMLTAFSGKQKMELAPNPFFDGPKLAPSVFSVEYLPLFFDINSSLQTAAFDLILPFSLDVSRFAKIDPELRKFDLLSQPRLSRKLTRLTFSFKNPVFSDARLRRALVLLTDTNAINTKLFHGMNAVHKGFLRLQPNILPQDANIELGLRLLSEAGWKATKGGRFKRGKRLSLTFYTNKESDVRLATYKLIRDQWAAHGIELILKTSDSATFFQKVLKDGTSDGLYCYSDEFDINVARQHWHRESILDLQAGINGKNFGGYKSDAVDKLLEAIGQDSLKEKMRAQYIDHLERSLELDPPWIPLFYENNFVVYKDKLPEWINMKAAPLEVSCSRL